MPYRSIIAALTVGIAALCAPPPLAAAPIKRWSLSELYHKALEKSELVSIRDQQIKIAQAQYDEALAALYPNADIVLTERFRSVSNTNNSTSTGSGSTFSNGGRAHSQQAQAGISVSQPIFSGFRDIALAEAAEAEIAGAQQDSARIRETLYGSVAEAFFQVGLHDGDCDELLKSETVLRQRIHELEERLALGKSREGEVLSARSNLSDVSAAYERAAGLRSASKEALAFFAGMPAQDIDVGPVPVFPPLQVLESYLSRAMKRADIMAAEARRRSVERQLFAARRESWPALSVQGGYYPYIDPGDDNAWDVLFRLEIPLFKGGAIDARVAEQEALLRNQDLLLSEARRLVERSVRTAYVNLDSSQRQLVKLRELIRSNERNYESQKHDYGLGLVNNIDVLQSIQQLYDARRQFNAAQANMHLNRVQLDVAAGEAVP